MTSSAKKKKDKKKDFQKQQLKVGKTKPKPSNYTDTSFKAKSIVVQAQSLSVDGPTTASQFSHHVSMLKSRSDSQRAESLAFLTATISQNAESKSKSLPESATTLIPKLQSLLLDTSPKVRQQLLKLLQCLSDDDVRSQTETLLLYLHATMTTLHSDIRAYSMDALEWLMGSVGHDVVTCAGGWFKTLSCFQSLLGWQDGATTQNGWSSHQKPASRVGTDHKVLKKQLLALNRFLKLGLGGAHQHSTLGPAHTPLFPITQLRQHSVPERSSAYTYLHLYGTPQDDEPQIMEDAEDRLRVFAETFAPAFANGIDSIVKDGGDLGRAAGLVKKTLEDSLSNYDREAVLD